MNRVACDLSAAFKSAFRVEDEDSDFGERTLCLTQFGSDE
jgi:hypothetical protein